MNNKPTLNDFKKTVSDYLSFDMCNFLKNKLNKTDFKRQEVIKKQEFVNYKLIDLFEIQWTKKSYNKNKLNNLFNYKVKNSFPYVIRTNKNNWVKWYIIEDEKYLNPENTLCLSIFSVSYQKEKYFTWRWIHILKPKFEKNSKLIMFYLQWRIKECLECFRWWMSFTKKIIENLEISLPTKDGKIDYEFIEDFIEELEALRVEECEAYLRATWLKDYSLTSEEEKVLSDFEKEKVKFGEYKLEDLFEIDNWEYWKNKKYNKWLKLTNDAIPVISGITENNWINYYTNDNLSNDEIFEWELTISTRWEYSWTVFYHNYKFVLANNVLVMKIPNLSKNKKIFIWSLISNFSYWGYNNYPKKEMLKNDKIQLPTINNEPNYEFMEIFISAIQKLVIKDVVICVENKNNY